MRIPEIKRNLNLETVLKHYNLQPDQSNRLICPWHPDKKPSLQVYPKTSTWTCFSTNCNAGSGDVIDFIMKFESISKYEAIQRATELVLGAAPQVSTSKEEVEKEQSAPVEPKKAEQPKVVLMDRTATLNKAFDYFKTGIRLSGKQLQSFLESRELNKNLLEMGYNSGQFHHRENSQYVESYLKGLTLKTMGRCLLLFQKKIIGNSIIRGVFARVFIGLF